jgi:hypothetical protein
VVGGVACGLVRAGHWRLLVLWCTCAPVACRAGGIQSAVLRVNTYLMRWAGKKYKRLSAYKRFKKVVVRAGRTGTPAIRPLGLGARAGRIAIGAWGAIPPDHPTR